MAEEKGAQQDKEPKGDPPDSKNIEEALVKEGYAEGGDENKSDSPSGKAKIAIIDYYKSAGSNGIEKAKKAIEKAGYEFEVYRHSKAKKLGIEYFKKNYGGLFKSGSGKAWKPEGKTESGKPLMKYDDQFARDAVKAGIPIYAVCHGAYTVHQAINDKHKIVNTKKMNKKVDDEGHEFHHQYGMLADKYSDHLEDVKTFEHGGEKLIKSYNKGNIAVRQHHAERTKEGIQDIKNFFDPLLKGGEPSNYKAKSP